MDLNLGNILNQEIKSIGQNFLKEIKKVMQKENISVDSKVKIAEKRNEIINNYADLYEVKNGELFLHKKDIIEPEFIDSTDLENGFYKDDKKTLDAKLTEQINEEINIAKDGIIEEEKEFINSQKKEGEEYTVDEIGDDEKYVFLTRKSTGTEFQEFISDELYKELLSQTNKSEITLVFKNNNYKIK